MTAASSESMRGLVIRQGEEDHGEITKKEGGWTIELHYSSGSSEKKEEPVGNYDRLVVEVNVICAEEADSGLNYTFDSLTETKNFV